ncbi:MAG: hypothetical protein RR277_04880, partial [Rikenellaceae bacterium]
MKNLLLSLVSVLALSATSFDLMAQQTRKEKHQEENQALNQQLSNAIQQQDFQFLATEIIYGQDPNLQNIPLYQLYGIWISPDYLKIYLPLYGPNNFNGQ